MAERGYTEPREKQVIVMAAVSSWLFVMCKFGIDKGVKSGKRLLAAQISVLIMGSHRPWGNADSPCKSESVKIPCLETSIYVMSCRHRRGRGLSPMLAVWGVMKGDWEW